MKKQSLLSPASALLGLAIFALLIGVQVLRPDGESKYVADPEDWICGLGDLRQLTNPAQVDYESLMEATPWMKELRREGIDPQSARGLILRAKAQAEVSRACDVVRREFEHCSVWRSIRRRDGGRIPLRTKEVLEEIVVKKEAPARAPAGAREEIPVAAGGH